MSKTQTSSAVKKRFNDKTYVRHTFVTRREDLLQKHIEELKTAGGDLSGLIKDLLCQHWSIDREDTRPDYHLGYTNKGNSIWIPNEEQ